MNIIRQAVRLFPRTTYTDRKAVNHLRREYIKARQYLGEKWILARQVGRKVNTDGAVLIVSVAGGLPILIHNIALKVMA